MKKLPLIIILLLFSNLASAVTITAELKQGWNLVSIPVNPGYLDMLSIYSQLNPYFQTAIIYDRSNQEYVELTMSNFLNFDWRQGAWMKVTQDVNIQVSGSPFSSTMPIVQGWNLVGHPHLNSINIQDSIYKDYVIFSHVNGEWLSYDPNRPFNDLAVLEPEKGYWVIVP